MTDAIVGAKYYDSTMDREFVVEGIYERTVREEDGTISGTKVIVDASYDDTDDLVAIELQNFKTDPGIELVETPEWF